MIVVGVVGLSDYDKVLPEDRSEVVEVPPKVFWDFVVACLKAEAGEDAVDRINSMPAEEVFEKVFKKGSIELGGSARMVKCPNNESACCFVFEDPRDGFDGYFCSGEAISKKKKFNSFISPDSWEKTDYERGDLPCGCSYQPDDLYEHDMGSCWNLLPRSLVDALYEVLTEYGDYSVEEV